MQCHVHGPGDLRLAAIQARQELPSVHGCRLEMLEASGCTLLSCSVAWHAQAAGTAPQHHDQQQLHTDTQDMPDSSTRFSSVQAAVVHAMAALNGVRPPAVASAPALQVRFPC